MEKEGFVTIRFASSDGSEGEVLIETDDAEALFIRLKRDAQYQGQVVNRNQLTLELENGHRTLV